MIWLNNYKSNDNTQINFYQVFIENKQVYNDEKENTIYSFESTERTEQTEQTDAYNFKHNKYENIECDIKIIDHVISYLVLSGEKKNKNFVFTMKTNFIKPTDNELNVPIFNHIYKSTSTKSLPNLIESKYCLSSTLNFKIYNLDTDNSDTKIQFVIETNPLTNIIRKYFITTNLNSLQKYFINK
jgi:hypothetical protein